MGSVPPDKGPRPSRTRRAVTRVQGDSEKTKASAQDFIRVLSEFQAKVQKIEGGR